jgi:hypothetical protein
MQEPAARNSDEENRLPAINKSLNLCIRCITNVTDSTVKRTVAD